MFDVFIILSLVKNYFTYFTLLRVLLLPFTLLFTFLRWLRAFLGREIEAGIQRAWWVEDVHPDRMID